MAESLHAELMLLAKQSLVRKGTYIARVHSVQAMESVFKADVQEARRKKLDGTSGKPSGQPTQYSSKKTENTLEIHFKTFGKGKFQGVDDERVRNIDLSIGTVMKKMAGIEPIGSDELFPIIKDDSRLNSFLNLYKAYGDGEKFDADKLELLDGGIEYLMGLAICNATALCATVAGAVDSRVAPNYVDAELIAIDEAARVPEYQWWPLLVFYPKAIGKIMVGDPDQLQPHIGKGQDKNPFKAQLEVSLQSRLQSEGFPSAFFTIQYRALPEILPIYNNVVYEGLLTSDDSTELARQPLAQDLRRFNKEHYGIEKNVILFDINAKEERDPTTMSRYCDDSVHRVMIVLENLIKADFKGCVIAILTPYKAQEKKLNCAKTRMVEQGYPKASEVVIETIDKVQGMEYDIVIVDPVVVKSPGFLDIHRLNVLFSRAKCGLYVIGDCSAWQRMHMDDSLPLRKFSSQLQEFRRPWLSWAAMGCPGNPQRRVSINLIQPEGK